MEGTNKRHLSSIFTFKIEQNDNGTFIASVQQDGRRLPHQDDVGALYYVVAVILIYGCSILMMIASYIRKNKVSTVDDAELENAYNVLGKKRDHTSEEFFVIS